jgi:putative two-component system response regulator
MEQAGIKPRLLIIDDEPFFLDLLSEALSPHFNISLAKNARQGLKLAQGEARPDLILLDIIMPLMDGYTACEQLKQNPLTRDIPVIFLTGKHDTEDELKGFNLGAVDYIIKPISIPILLTRVRTQLALSQQRIALEQLVQERTAELDKTRDAIVYGMGEMAEARDSETGNHLLRTREYVRILAQQLAATRAYQSILTPRLIDTFRRAAPLHDIGKIRIPETILRKTSPLTAEERLVMNRHPLYGKEIINNAERKIGSTLFIGVARDIAFCHHEKWDGSGYPRKLQAKAIPLSARLMAVADVYDALVSKRCYKEAMTHRSAMDYLHQQSGAHFDPDIIHALDGAQHEFGNISNHYKDL